MTASITISLELELAWGQHDKGGSNIYSTDRSAEEYYFDQLLETCDEQDIPISFDVVGHLLLDSCEGIHDSPHEHGWFDADPGTDADTDPLFYWPEVTDIIADRDTSHELATHTFSHALCDEIDDETLIWELSQSFDLHEQHGFHAPRTIVTPRHREVSYPILRDAGIDGIRAVKTHPRESFVARYKQRAAFWTLNRGHPAYEPQRTDGLVELYTTPYPSLTTVHLPNGQQSPLWAFRRIPLSIRQRIQQSYLDGALETAIETDSNVHLWTHLYNMSNQAQWEVIESFLERLGKAQRDGEVDVLTMADLTTHY